MAFLARGVCRGPFILGSVMGRVSQLIRPTLTGFGVAVLLTAAGCERPAPNDASNQRFLESHWSYPLPAQGAPPTTYSALEASLGPTACGTCHRDQLQAWRGSLHSRAMGPGISWQLQLMDQAQGNRCLRCHAPLAEQKALVALERNWPAAPAIPPPAYVPPTLAQQGVVCAACHVRGHKRYGPPKQGSAPSSGQLPHGGFVATKAFEDSRFCAACHQFPENGPRVAGKLQEDTYNQWAKWPGAAERTCQSCHMPDRRHLFRGIHDQVMTRSAIEASINVKSIGKGMAAVRVALRNTGAGHHFPTYMVPKVYTQLDLITGDGRHRVLVQDVVGWQVDLTLSGETFDTRIPAGGVRFMDASFALPEADSARLELVIRVAPAEHYERAFRHSLAASKRLPAMTKALLQQALAEAVATRYELLRQSVALTIAN